MSNSSPSRQLSMSVLVLLGAAIGVQGAPRHEAAFVDDSRVVGDNLSGWRVASGGCEARSGRTVRQE